MSSCLVLCDKNNIFVGSDTATSCFLNDRFYRVSESRQKIFLKNDNLIFCSGDTIISDKVISFISESKNINETILSDFIKSLKIKKINNIFNLEILFFKIEDGQIKIFQISEYNSFDIRELSPGEDIQIFSAGFKTVEALDIAEKYICSGLSVFDIYEKTFKELSCEQVGGRLQLWKMSSSPEKILDTKIEEKNIEYLPSHSLIAETVVGRLLAGNNLTITNQNNTFTVNGNGATLTNATLTVNTTSGKTKIFLDPTNGIKIQGLVGGNWQDKFYADSNGNVIFSGNLSGATGTFSGTLSAATITGGTITGASINGGTISGTTGTFSGNVYAANLQGLVTSDQINSLIASKIGAGTMSNVNLSGGRGSITVGGAGQMLIAGTNGISITDSFLITADAPSMRILCPLTLSKDATFNANVSISNGYLSVPGGNISTNYQVSCYNLSASSNVNAQQYYSRGYIGITGQVPYYTGSTTRYLQFAGGICVGW
jgi:hypothetical protein